MKTGLGMLFVALIVYVAVLALSGALLAWLVQMNIEPMFDREFEFQQLWFLSIIAISYFGPKPKIETK